MKNVFKVLLDPNEKYSSIQSYDIGSFDLTSFWDGRKCDPNCLEHARLYLNLPIRVKTDAIGNPLSWLIWSERLVDISLPLIQNDVHVLSAPLFDSRSRQPIPGYFIVNILSVVACVKMEKSKIATDNEGNFMGFHEPHFDQERLSPNIHLFRAREWIFSVFISEPLRSQWKSKNIGGLLLKAFQSS